MRTSETVTDLVAALVKARPAFKAVAKTKTAKTGSYSYDYADLAQIIDATTDALTKAGLVVTQAPSWDDDLSVLVLVTRLWHTSGQWLETRYPLRSYDKPQEQGSAITYARRYSLGALLGIAAEEDDDAQTAQHATPPPKPVAAAPKPAAVAKPPAAPEAPKALKKGSISEQQQKRLFAIAKGAGWTTDQIRDVLRVKFKFEHTADISWSSYDDIVAFFAKPPADEDENARLAEQLAFEEEEARRLADEDDRPPF